MSELLPCPCGQRPDSFALESVGVKYAIASPNCCNEWSFEFRINYEQDTAKVAEMAAEAWNALPRRSPLSQETVEQIKAALNVYADLRYSDSVKAVKAQYVLEDIARELGIPIPEIKL